MATTYANYDDLLRRYRAFAEDFRGGAPNANSHAIYYAERQVEAMLAEQYAIPLPTTSAIVTDLVIDLTYHNGMIGKNAKVTDPLWEWISERIEKLKDGDMALVKDDGTFLTAAETNAVYHNMAGYKTTHDMRDAECQRVDPDRLDAEDAADS